MKKLFIFAPGFVGAPFPLFSELAETGVAIRAGASLRFPAITPLVEANRIFPLSAALSIMDVQQ